MISMTVAQRCRLARLRVSHPRARVTLINRNRQHLRPTLRVRMRWSQRGRTIWIRPDGSWTTEPTR